MDKILITGSSGFIAKNLISYLSKNYFIKTLSLNSNDYKIDLSTEVPNIIEKFDIVIIVAGIAHKNVKNKYNLNIGIQFKEDYYFGFNLNTHDIYIEKYLMHYENNFDNNSAIKSNLFLNKLFASFPPTFPSPIKPIFIIYFLCI
mgnify:CR=1 FL=1